MSTKMGTKPARPDTLSKITLIYPPFGVIYQELGRQQLQLARLDP